MEPIKKVAAVHDISGLGRCSLTVAIPILSIIGVQVCPFPTAVLSCQTAYEHFSFLDLTNEMKSYKEKWEQMNFKFDGVYSGFLGSEEQIDIVYDFIANQRDTIVVVDPVMGDNGEVYKTYTESMCNKMKKLVEKAYIVTPNLTEACILTGEQYCENNISQEKIEYIIKKIADLGPKKVVITGIVNGDYIYNYAYDREEDSIFKVKTKYIKACYSGTGDIFASILCGMMINKCDFKYSIEKATSFIEKAIQNSLIMNVDPLNGVAFEPLLKELCI